MKQTPISALILTGGMPYFARMLDKIRKHARGELREDFHEMISVGFDGRYCRFFGIAYADLKARTLQGGTDEEILAWCRQNGRKVTDEDIAIFSTFCRKRGWRDEATVNLEKNKAESGLAHRTDLVTFFDYYEVDEGRAPR
jgi:gluconokinase